MIEENLRSQESNASQELTFAADTDYQPELDRPFEPEVAEPAAPPRQRDQNGRFVSPEEPGFQHDPTIARMARDLGFKDDEIEQTPPQVLSDRVYHVQKRTVEMLAAERKAMGQGIHAQSPASQVMPAREEFDPESVLKDGMYDEGLTKVLRHVLQENKTLKSQLDGERQVREASSKDEQIDQFFLGLKKDALFGAGTHKQLASSSAEMKRRRAVVLQASQSQDGSLGDRLKAAYQDLYGSASRPDAGEEDSAYDTPGSNGHAGVNRIRGRVPDSLQRRREVWDEEGPLAVPTNRKPAPLNPETRAALAARRFMEENQALFSDLGNDDRDP